MNSALKSDLDRPEKLNEPVLRGDKISAERFYSTDYYRKEWSRMWTKTWHIAGMSYSVKDAGEYITHNLGQESLIFVRQTDGSLRGYYNACVHRGARLVNAREGFAELFTCPYHGWQYDAQGEVVDVPSADDYKQGNPCGKLKLKQVACTELFGMIWFNLDSAADPLSKYLGENVVNEIGSYRIEEMTRVMNMSAEVECNWKLITDNFNEAYHVRELHPQLLPYIESHEDHCQFDMLANGHNRGWFPAYQQSGVSDSTEPEEPLPSIIAEWGLDISQYSGLEGMRRIRKDILKQKRLLGPERGYKHYEHLADYQLTDYTIYNLFPNTVITVGPDGVQLLRPRPHPSDPEKCLFDHWWMVPHIEGRTHTPSPSGGPDLPVEDAELEEIVHGEKTLGETCDQDVGIGKIQQAGLHSAGFEEFYLSNQERRVQHFHERLNDYLED